MRKYKLKIFEYKKIKDTWEFEFDPGDQDLWDKLIAFAENHTEDFYRDELPFIAPTDPEAWFDLINSFYCVDNPFICTKKDEVIVGSVSGPPMDFGYQLEDKTGNILVSEAYDDMF
jgi:hypothetical protein